MREVFIWLSNQQWFAPCNSAMGAFFPQCLSYCAIMNIDLLDVLDESSKGSWRNFCTGPAFLHLNIIAHIEVPELYNPFSDRQISISLFHILFYISLVCDIMRCLLRPLGIFFIARQVFLSLLFYVSDVSFKLVQQ